MRSRIYALVLGGLALAAGCGSGPDEKDGFLAPKAAKKSPEELWSLAQRKEATGDRARSFARIQFYQEAMLAYQSLADHHPRCGKAGEARTKVKSVRKRVDALVGWKKRWDAFDAATKKKGDRPAYLAEAKREAGVFASAPFGFLRTNAAERLKSVEARAEKTVRRAFETLRTNVDALTAKRDWPAAWAVFGSFDPEYGTAFPSYGQKVADLKSAVTDKAKTDADALIDRAAKKAESVHPFEGVRLIVRSRGRFSGLPFEADVRKAERSLRAQASRKILEEREIASKVKPPEPEAETPPEAEPPAGSHEEKVKRAMESPRVRDEVPDAAKAFEGAADPLAEADAWYYKAVALEKKTMPGDEGYVDNLKHAVRMYEKVRALYTHLLEKNKGPSEEIEQRLEKVNQALFWCNKNLPLTD
jgi:hypothetical protein